MPAPTIKTRHHTEFTAGALAAAKHSQTISVCLPARNEAGTIGPIVETLRTELGSRVPLIDEVVVIDDHSDDQTARIAGDAGATVVAAASVLPEYGEGHGKGEALWKSLFVSRGDLVVWCDSDIREFGTRFPVGLLGPLLTDPRVSFVKGSYARPTAGRAGGGRVTELAARPMLSLLFPHLAPIVQPLAGEYAGRRSLLERLPFVQGYGVDLGLLIDVAETVGVGRIQQTDLGTRVHRNRPLDELSPQATAVIQVALRRVDPSLAPPSTLLNLPGGKTIRVEVRERPPLIEVPAYRRASA